MVVSAVKPDFDRPDGLQRGQPVMGMTQDSLLAVYKITSRDTFLSRGLFFNCVYCEFGCYSRGRLEAHCTQEHPGRPFKVSNLDKRINSVQVVKETADGVDILGELID